LEDHKKFNAVVIINSAEVDALMKLRDAHDKWKLKIKDGDILVHNHKVKVIQNFLKFQILE
jgi:hypothetical protein